jgi:hypothetical protein
MERLTGSVSTEERVEVDATDKRDSGVGLEAAAAVVSSPQSARQLSSPAKDDSSRANGAVALVEVVEIGARRYRSRQLVIASSLG